MTYFVQVEQLLETYFMNLDNTWNRLCALAEHVDDAEDYIKFDIDTKRNKCGQHRIALSSSCCLLSSSADTRDKRTELIAALVLSQVHRGSLQPQTELAFLPSPEPALT